MNALNIHLSVPKFIYSVGNFAGPPQRSPEEEARRSRAWPSPRQHAVAPSSSRPLLPLPPRVTPPVSAAARRPPLLHHLRPRSCGQGGPGRACGRRHAPPPRPSPLVRTRGRRRRPRSLSSPWRRNWWRTWRRGGLCAWCVTVGKGNAVPALRLLLLFRRLRHTVVAWLSPLAAT